MLFMWITPDFSGVLCYNYEVKTWYTFNTTSDEFGQRKNQRVSL